MLYLCSGTFHLLLLDMNAKQRSTLKIWAQKISPLSYGMADSQHLSLLRYLRLLKSASRRMIPDETK